MDGYGGQGGGPEPGRESGWNTRFFTSLTEDKLKKWGQFEVARK
jgi:hypothetical protein